MGLGWLLAILRAVPSLERLFLHIADGIKQHRANTKYEDELDHIDAAIANAGGGMQDGRVSGTQWSFDVDRSPPGSDSGAHRPSGHSVSIAGGSEAEPHHKE